MIARVRSLAIAVLLAACGARPALEAPNATSPPPDPGVLADDLRVRRLTEGVWMFTASSPEGSGEPSANGLVIDAGDHAILVDTGWTGAQARTLASWAERTLGHRITVAMITSVDADRIGGVPALTELGVTVFSSLRTAALAAERGTPITTSPIEPGSIPELHWMWTRIDPYPEAIVAYHRASRTVYGGRFIEERAATQVGRDDGDRLGWRAALDLVPASYPEAAIVVPGRGEPGTLELVEHTRSLIADCRADDECVVTTEVLESCECCYYCTEPRALTRERIERERSMRLSCEPVCPEDLQCPRCATPEELAALRAVCHRGECEMRPAQ
jgi:metallo-beta-lactamase class B